MTTARNLIGRDDVKHFYQLRLRSADGVRVGPYASQGFYEEVEYKLDNAVQGPPWVHYEAQMTHYSMLHSMEMVDALNNAVNFSSTADLTTRTMHLQSGILTREEMCAQLEQQMRTSGDANLTLVTVRFDGPTGSSVFNTHTVGVGVRLYWGTGPDTNRSAAQLFGFDAATDIVDPAFARNQDSYSPLAMDPLQYRTYTFGLSIATTPTFANHNPITEEIATVPIPMPEQRYTLLSGNGNIVQTATIAQSSIVTFRVRITDEYGFFHRRIGPYYLKIQLEPVINKATAFAQIYASELTHGPASHANEESVMMTDPFGTASADALQAPAAQALGVDEVQTSDGGAGDVEPDVGEALVDDAALEPLAKRARVEPDVNDALAALAALVSDSLAEAQ